MSLRRVEATPVGKAALLCAALAVVATGRAVALRPPTIDPTYGRPVPRLKYAAPVPASNWIWSQATSDNQRLLLRRSFILPATPRAARVLITADNFFTLYVNGAEVVATHPTAGDDFVWRQVHSADVTRLLRPGRNALAVSAVNAGGPAGLLALLTVNGKPILRTDSSWRVHDTEGAGDGWTAADMDDSGWAAATVEAPVGSGPWGDSLSGWPNLEEAPYLAHITLPPSAISEQHPGRGALQVDARQPGALTVMPAGSADSAPWILVDFGKEIAGRVRVESDRSLEAQVGTGESRGEALHGPWGGVHTLMLAADRPDFTPYSAFRFARIAFPASGAPTQARVRITVDHKYYPVVYRGSFDCSDPLLTRIWYTGAYTAHLCMQEDIWDAPKRDRARWMGDLHVSGEVINDVFADRFLMEQTMQRLRDDAQGGRPPSELPTGHVNGIPGYSCAWICGLADFYRHTGDQTYLNRQHDLLLSLLAYMKGDLDDRGLFANRHGAWPFVDWSPDFNGDGPRARAATQFFMIYAAKEAAFLLRSMGDAVGAASAGQWAAELAGAAQKYLINPETGLVSDRRQDSAMAIVSGAVTPEQERDIYQAVFQEGSPAWNQVATPYYDNYVITAMSEAGHTPDALDFVRRYWGGMLAEGATTFWEGYDLSWPKAHFHEHLQADNGMGYFVSLCHGWSSGATSWLTERVLGIRPTAAGFSRVTIQPQLCDLKWATGSVPTPRGPISLSASRRSTEERFDLSLPPATRAAVDLGAGRRVRLVSSPAGSLARPGSSGVLELSGAGRYELLAQSPAR